MHHPFTSPDLNDIDLFDSDPSKINSLGYDIVMNGYELGGGSIRIHDRHLQSKVFKLLGIDEKEAEEKFGFLMGHLSMEHHLMEVLPLDWIEL